MSLAFGLLIGPWANLGMTARSTGFIHLAASSPLTPQQISAVQPPAVQAPVVQAQFSPEALSQQGLQAYGRGDFSEAQQRWTAAALAFEQQGDRLGALRSQLNAIQALGQLGLYRRALGQSQSLQPQLQQMLDQRIAPGIALGGQRQYGELLQRIGSLQQAQRVLQTVLDQAQRLTLARDTSRDTSRDVSQDISDPNTNSGGSPTPIQADLQADLQAEATRARYALAAIAQSQGRLEPAIHAYQTAIAQAPDALRGSGQLALLRLYLRRQQWSEATALWPQVRDSLALLPPSRTSLYQRLEWTRQLLQWRSQVAELPSTPSLHPGPLQPPPLSAIASELQQILAAAEQLGDPRAIAYALGTQGELAAQQRDWAVAQSNLQQALLRSEALNAPDLSYRWHWQLGRIWQTQGRIPDAIAAAQAAVDQLQRIRGEIAIMNPNVQYTFSQDIEPIYRDLLNLLLLDPPNPASSTVQLQQAQLQQAQLQQAQNVMEQLRLGELETFLGEPCLPTSTQSQPIETFDERAALLYPVVLNDRLELLVQLPRHPLRRYRVAVPGSEVRQTVQQWRRALVLHSSAQYLPLAQQLHRWLIVPIALDLQRSGVQTLVFSLDPVLQGVPMAALHDGQHYLLESYAVALAPTLRLLQSQSRPLRATSSLIAAGLSESRQGFGALPGVLQEMEQLQQQWSRNTILLNQRFTEPELQRAIASQPAILHLATHGQFSSNPEDTFLLTWDHPLAIQNLDSLLGERSQSTPLELLVLSACETASGDDNASLGLAGMAVKLGAQSTMATLWSVDDAAIASLMAPFYHQLQQGQGRAEALRQAQLTLLKNPYFNHPLYWSAYVLVGNWL